MKTLADAVWQHIREKIRGIMDEKSNTVNSASRTSFLQWSEYEQRLVL